MTNRLPFAIHGFACAVPAHWDVAVNRGEWGSGHVVLVERREPKVNITWSRRSRTPDCDGTLRKLSRTMFRDRKAMLSHLESFGNGGAFARYEGGDGSYHAVAFCPDPDSALVLVIRQLVPGGRDELFAIARSARVAAPEGPIPWRIHGLAADLHPAWRLSGINHYAGLVRALWLHQLPQRRRRRHDQALVLRRFACASRVLDERGIAGWVSDRLGRRERLEGERIDQDGTWSAWSVTPREGWLFRALGRRQERHLCAWLEPEMDRLVVQEWYGKNGVPPPPQRRPSTLDDLEGRAA